MIKKRFLLLAILFVLNTSTNSLATNQHIYFTNSDTKIEEKILNYNWDIYINELDQKLKSNWFHSKDCQDVEISFKITKDGRYKDIKVLKPSINTNDNLAAIDAVLYTAPFKPIPLDINNIEVKYTFNTKKNNSLIKVIVAN